MFDTGMSFIGGSAANLDPIAKKMGATYDESARTYLISCDAPNLPNIEFQFGEAKIVLTPEDYLQLSGVSFKLLVILLLQQKNISVNNWFLYYFQYSCMISLTRITPPDADFLLGDPFLR